MNTLSARAAGLPKPAAASLDFLKGRKNCYNYFQAGNIFVGINIESS